MFVFNCGVIAQDGRRSKPRNQVSLAVTKNLFVRYTQDIRIFPVLLYSKINFDKYVIHFQIGSSAKWKTPSHYFRHNGKKPIILTCNCMWNKCGGIHNHSMHDDWVKIETKQLSHNTQGNCVTDPAWYYSGYCLLFLELICLPRFDSMLENNRCQAEDIGCWPLVTSTPPSVTQAHTFPSHSHEAASFLHAGDIFGER